MKRKYTVAIHKPVLPEGDIYRTAPADAYDVNTLDEAVDMARMFLQYGRQVRITAKEGEDDF